MNKRSRKERYLLKWRRYYNRRPMMLEVFSKPFTPTEKGLMSVLNMLLEPIGRESKYNRKRFRMRQRG